MGVDDVEPYRGSVGASGVAHNAWGVRKRKRRSQMRMHHGLFDEGRGKAISRTWQEERNINDLKIRPR